jgi:large repetitive protein
MIYFPAGSGMHAVRPDGSVLWEYGPGMFYPATPALANGTLYFTADNALRAVNPDGTLEWLSATNGVIAGAAPVIAGDGTIYIGANDNHLYAFGPDEIVKWTFETGGAVSAPAAVDADGSVYFGSLDKTFYAVDSAGKLKWSFPTGGEIRSAPLITAQQTICFGSDDGKLYFLRGDASLGESVWPMFQHDAGHTGRSLIQPLAPTPPVTLSACKRNCVRWHRGSVVVLCLRGGWDTKIGR